MDEGRTVIGGQVVDRLPEAARLTKKSLSKDRLVLGEVVLGGRDGSGVDAGTDEVETDCGADAGGSTTASAKGVGAISSCNTLKQFPMGT